MYTRGLIAAQGLNKPEPELCGSLVLSVNVPSNAYLTLGQRRWGAGEDPGGQGDFAPVPDKLHLDGLDLLREAKHESRPAVLPWRSSPLKNKPEGLAHTGMVGSLY